MARGGRCRAVSYALQPIASLIEFASFSARVQAMLYVCERTSVYTEYVIYVVMKFIVCIKIQLNNKYNIC